MDAHNFLSATSYVVLPTKSNPKVFLPIDNSEMAALGFELYNPFSRKAKVLKSIVKFLTVYLNPIAKLVLPTVEGEKTDLVKFLERTFEKKITTSIYIATEKDKFVLQLQYQNNILGYLKYPISELGKKRLANEERAISILARQQLVPQLILSAIHKESAFFVLQNLNGTIGQMRKQEYRSVLNKLKKDTYFELNKHPRIIILQKRLEQQQNKSLKINFNKTIALSKKKYLEVFEHGDFAPWNLITTSNGIIPFDFEYFEEYGLEYLDEIKYHFQEQNLLYHKFGKQLIQAISSKVMIEEFDILFHIFLIKEILNKKDIDVSCAFEKSLLNLIAPNES